MFAFRTKVALLIILTIGILNTCTNGQLVQRNGGSVEEEPVLGVEPQNSTVWGPGLAPHIIVLPARYFFVQLMGPGGERYATLHIFLNASKLQKCKMYLMTSRYTQFIQG